MHTIGNETIVIIVAPESHEVLEADDNIEVIDVIVVNSSGEVQMSEPQVFSIGKAYPNPFNPTTTLNYSIPENGYLEVNIFDLQGRLVESLYADYASAGQYAIVWNADKYSSGIYFVKLISGEYINTKRIVLIK
mgnify:CR=1 FL=1